jgi:hypothetical protein
MKDIAAVGTKEVVRHEPGNVERDFLLGLA